MVKITPFLLVSVFITTLYKDSILWSGFHSINGVNWQINIQVEKGALVHHLQYLTACLIQRGRFGLEIGQTPQTTFTK